MLAESEGTDPQSLSDEEGDSEPRTPSTPIDPMKDFAEGVTINGHLFPRLTIDLCQELFTF